MKTLHVLLIVLLLAGCNRRPTETTESLMANPERLKALREQCKTDRSKPGDELCNRAAEAMNRRFFGEDKVSSTPR